VDAARAFRQLVGGLEYPMFIVTARARDELLGVHCVPEHAVEPGHEA
jgi:hypothetical protein